MQCQRRKEWVSEWNKFIDDIMRISVHLHCWALLRGCIKGRRRYIVDHEYELEFMSA